MPRRRRVTDLPALAKAIRAGEQRALGRGISLLESSSPEGEQLLALLPPTGDGESPDGRRESPAGRAGGDSPDPRASAKNWVIGVTGSPGVGKSTLVSRLIMEVRNQGDKVAVLAVDPSSPFSGGALLGDRVRMNLHGTDPGVFIRSVASGRHAGGLSPAAVETVSLLHAAGYGTVIVESVGVGQSEVGILSLADLSLVVVQPGSGDEIQALKAGVMEIADLFVVNKADHPGVDAVERSLRDIIEGGSRTELPPEIVRTVATDGTGLQELYEALARRLAALDSSGELERRRRERLVGAFEEMAIDVFREWLRRTRITDPREGLSIGAVSKELSQMLEELEQKTEGGRQND